jgi:hypothetical protein
VRAEIGWSAAAALAIGALLALLAGAPRGTGTAQRRGPARWVAADRDGCELVLLDEDLMVVERRALPWPTHVRAFGRDGSLWVVSALAGHPRGAQELLRMDALGRVEALHALPPAVDLEVEASGRAWVLVRPSGGGAEVWTTEGGSAPARLPAPTDARALVVAPDRIALVSPGQGLLLLDEASGCWMPIAGPATVGVLDAAPAAGGGWWLLVRGGAPGSERVLHLVGRRAARIPCSGAEWLVGPGPTGGACWVVGEDGGWLRRVVAARGGRGLFVCPAAEGGRAAALDAEGGLVLAAGGALLRLRSDGSAAPGQGGFAHLSDLDRLGGRRRGGLSPGNRRAAARR